MSRRPEAGRHEFGWAGVCQRSFFKLHVGMQVHLSSLCGFVTEPKSDHAEIHAAAEQSHGRAVTQGVRCHCLGCQRWAALTCCGDMSQNESAAVHLR